LLRTVIGGAVVAVIAGLLAFVGSAIGITTLWPVLLAAGVALVAGPAVASRLGSFAMGAILGFGAMAVQAALLPQVAASQAIIVVVAIAIMTVVAAVSMGLLPLWASLLGYAAFVGYYTPTYTESPTLFATEAPVALLTVLVAAGVGAIVGILAEFAGAGFAGREDTNVATGEVA
jgi:hypothetical protein